MDASTTDVSAFTDGLHRDLVAQPRDTAIRRSGDVAERIGMALDAAMAVGDATTAYILLDRLLDEVRTPLIVFRQLVRLWGGGETFSARIRAFLAEHGDARSDMIGVLSGKGTVAMRIARRLDDDRPPADGFDWNELGELAGEAAPIALVAPAALAMGPMGGLILAGAGFYVLKPHLDEVFATAKKFWDEFADGLAESDSLGGVLLATVAQTVNDLFLPGSTIEAVLSVLPIGKLGVLIKAFFLKAAAWVGASLAARGLARIAAALMRFVRDLVETHVGRFLLPFENALADGIVSATSPEARKQAIGEALDFIRVFSQWCPLEKQIDDLADSARKAAAKRAKQVTRKQMRETVERLETVFPVPPGSPAKLAFEALPDSRVIQTIETTLLKNEVGRTEPALDALARKYGLVAAPGEHWSHIAANRLSGDDAMYNLLRADSLVNTSMFSKFDKLLPGTRIEVKVLFESAEDAMTRHAALVEYSEVLKSGERKFIGALKNLNNTPPQSLATMKRQALEAAKKLGQLDYDESTQQIIDLLAQIFEL